MSIPAGINFHDTKGFAERYPSFVKKGFKKYYELVGFKNWEGEDEKWGYLSLQSHFMKVEVGKDETYEELLEIVKDKNYFVISSNVDGLFERNGFDKSKIYTPQGDFGILQCYNKCRKDSYFDGSKHIEEMVRNTDRETTKLKNLNLIPKCPNCGGNVVPNLNGGQYYMSEPCKR